MKLMTLNEVTKQKQAEESRSIFRIEQIRETLNKETSRLNETEALFDRNLNTQRKQWAEEEAEHLKKIIELQQKITEYETKERSFFFPIDALEKKTYDNYERSKDILAESNRMLQDNDLLEEKLNDKLDSLSEKETDLQNREDKILSKELGIRDQEMKTRQLSEALAEKWQEFHARLAKFEEHKKRENEVIDLAKKSLESREKMLLEEKEKVRTEKIQLADGRETLKRAWLELERKK